MFAFNHLPVKDLEPVLTAVCMHNVMPLFLKTSSMMKQDKQKNTQGRSLDKRTLHVSWANKEQIEEFKFV